MGASLAGRTRVRNCTAYTGNYTIRRKFRDTRRYGSDGSNRYKNDFFFCFMSVNTENLVKTKDTYDFNPKNSPISCVFFFLIR